jgi:hypothetical protein
MENNRLKNLNRTARLQEAVIEDGFSKEICRSCNGKGKHSVFISSALVKNLKNKSEHLCVENNCSDCDEGFILKKIRVIRNNKVITIL